MGRSCGGGLAGCRVRQREVVNAFLESRLRVNRVLVPRSCFVVFVIMGKGYEE